MSRPGVWGTVFGTALLLLPLAAAGQTNAPPPASYNTPPEVTRGPQLPTAYGTEVSLGGGVMNFTGAAARGMTNAGGSWDLRLAFGTRSIVGVEAAYLGTAQKVSAAGLDPNANLISNGVEGNLRLNAPFVTDRGLVEPFLLGGIGWAHYDVVNDSYNASVVRETDNQMTVPMGAGVAASYQGFMLDARFTYRFAVDEQLLGNADMGSWILSANIGREF
jgi:hypothetical protein